MFLFFGSSKPLLRNTLKLSVAGAALLCIGGGVPPFAFAQNSAYDPANYAWQSGAIRHAQKMRAYFDSDRGEQPTLPVIPKFEIDFDPSGLIATAQLGGPTQTSQNAFFGNLGTNGRTCFTCHQPQNGWSVSAASVQARFYASFGTDPIFRLASVDDPYNCNTNPVTGLTSPTTGIVSIYRRPLPAVNLGFLSAIMWDGREPTLAQQSIDATRGHAQASADPNTAQQQQIVNFESGIFTAQLFDNKAKFLNDDGATGGPVALQKLLPGFFIGINDPLGLNPKGTPFTSKIFDVYRAWKNIDGSGDVAAHRRSVARGEDLFNNTPINIVNVAGLNDVLNKPTIPGFCGTCHDTPDVGNHSVKAPLNIGVANAGADSPLALNISGLPV